MIPLFDKFNHLTKFVHVELSYEGGEMFMPEKVRKDFVFELLGVLD